MLEAEDLSGNSKILRGNEWLQGDSVICQARVPEYKTFEKMWCQRVVQGYDELVGSTCTGMYGREIEQDPKSCY